MLFLLEPFEISTTSSEDLITQIYHANLLFKSQGFFVLTNEIRRKSRRQISVKGPSEFIILFIIIIYYFNIVLLFILL